jgi:hypothetical protein
MMRQMGVRLYDMADGCSVIRYGRWVFGYTLRQMGVRLYDTADGCSVIRYGSFTQWKVSHIGELTGIKCGPRNRLDVTKET